MKTFYFNIKFGVNLIFLFCICINCEVDESEEGTFLFLSKNEGFSEDKSLIGGGVSNAKPQCHEDKLLSFLYLIQVINPESVIVLATKNKLEKTCVNVSKTVDKMQSYLKSCSLQPQQDVYTHLLKGVTTLHKKLCTNDPYHKAFMKYKKCFGQLNSEFDSCNGPADWADNSDAKKVCKAYREVADCYYIKTSVLCGNEGADIFKELVNSVIDSVIIVNCTTNTVFGNLKKISSITLEKNQKLIMSSTISLKPSIVVLFIGQLIIANIINISLY